MHRIYRFFAALLLLAYVSTGTAIMPAVVMVLAKLDGSHAVIVCQSVSGTKVLLHHRDAEFTPEVKDHASKLARCLVCLCKPSSEGDHSLATMGVACGLIHARDDVKRDLKDTPMLNTQATVNLIFHHSHPASLFHTQPPLFMAIRESGRQKPCAMATVQLLI
jgi:hypothetical protein|uniref:hypothetical protein n=1 Tax=Prosthecobacter sp. TaxID=1965333 RepID=UPI003782E2EF